jgi:hypothetical protein
VNILRSCIGPPVGNGAAKAEGTREGLVSNTGYLCLTWVSLEEFFLILILGLRCKDGSRVMQVLGETIDCLSTVVRRDSYI